MTSELTATGHKGHVFVIDDEEDLPKAIRSYEPEIFLVAPVGEEEIVPLALLQKRYRQRVMNLVAGNKSRAAKLLGVNRRTLHRWIEDDAAGPKSPVCPLDAEVRSRHDGRHPISMTILPRARLDSSRANASVTRSSG